MDRDGPRGNASVAPETESDRGGLRPGTLRSRERGREGPPAEPPEGTSPTHTVVTMSASRLQDSPYLMYEAPSWFTAAPGDSLKDGQPFRQQAPRTLVRVKRGLVQGRVAQPSPRAFFCC